MQIAARLKYVLTCRALEQNRFTESIPETLTTLTLVSSLTLHGNQLSGLLSPLVHLTQLQILYAHC